MRLSRHTQTGETGGSFNGTEASPASRASSSSSCYACKHRLRCRPMAVIATRVNKDLHAKVLRRQRDVKKLTGMEPSLSSVVRMMVQEAADAYEKKRKRGR